ncbi:MAG: hypothetical protein LBV72_07460 [Tannerella sp.]|jgi:hypothetical protein|nr:hypothetical protein [Tannerella sp.]
MKNKGLFFSIVMLLCAQLVPAQDGDINQYRRSSLYTIIIDDEGLMERSKAEIIKKTFIETPLPEKFNDHNLAARSVVPKDYPVTSAEIAAVKDTKPDDGSEKKEEKDDAYKLPAVMMKYFIQNHIAQDLIAKWYDKSSTYDPATFSFFDMDLIKQRGLYDASEFDKQMADKSTRGINMLADAGEDLVNNTFVVAIRFNYINKEEVGKKVSSTTSKIAGALGGKAGKIGRTTEKAVNTTTDVAARGYMVKATAFLFQLDWTDEVNAVFYQDYYNAPDLAEFYESDKFRLKYIGSVSDWSDVQSTKFSKKTEAELVHRAAVRSIDEVIAKLQKKYEPFRTKTPLLTTEPEVTAQIGMKEDVEDGDKFEVLEKNMDPETGKITYKRVTTLKAEKGKIWDNRYAADEEQAENAEQGEGAVQTIKATTFSGGNKNIYPGMLIRQIN